MEHAKLKDPLERMPRTDGPSAWSRGSDVFVRLERMRAAGTWLPRSRSLWADAFALVLLVSLRRASGDERFLDEARNLVARVPHPLGSGPSHRPE